MEQKARTESGIKDCNQNQGLNLESKTGFGIKNSTWKQGLNLESGGAADLLPASLGQHRLLEENLNWD